MKRPYKISQQTLKTDCTEHTINNKKYKYEDRQKATKIANKDLSSLIIFMNCE